MQLSQRRMMSIVRPLYVDCNQATAIAGPFGVVLWRGETTPAAVTRVRQMGLATIQQSQCAVGLIGIVENTAKVPDPECRRLSAKVNDELVNSGAVGLAAVIPGSGFSGAWIRGVVTALHLMARHRYPFRALESTTQACGWLAALIGESSLNWQKYADAIEEFRSEYAGAWTRELYDTPQGQEIAAEVIRE